MDNKDFEFDTQGSTQKEKEAVIVSKAMDLVDRDRRLSEDKEKERIKEDKLREKEQKEKDREHKRKKNRKRIGIIGIVLLILLLLFQAAILLKDKTPNTGTDFEFPDEFEDTIDISKIPELQVDTFDPLYSMLEIYINTTPVFENGLAAGNLLIGNPEGNVYNQVVEIYLKDKEYIEKVAKENAGKEKNLTENGFEEVDITKPVLKPKVLLYRTDKIKPGQAMKQLLRNTDEWLRRRIRAVYWKQWKKIKTRYRMIQKFGLPEWKVHELANCRKGIWRSTIMLNSVLRNKEIASLGYMSMTDYYLKTCEN